jgi:hypothetical protein
MGKRGEGEKAIMIPKKNREMKENETITVGKVRSMLGQGKHFQGTAFPLYLCEWYP